MSTARVALTLVTNGNATIGMLPGYVEGMAG